MYGRKIIRLRYISSRKNDLNETIHVVLLNHCIFFYEKSEKTKTLNNCLVSKTVITCKTFIFPKLKTRNKNLQKVILF